MIYFCYVCFLDRECLEQKKSEWFDDALGTGEFSYTMKLDEI